MVFIILTVSAAGVTRRCLLMWPPLVSVIRSDMLPALPAGRPARAGAAITADIGRHRPTSRDGQRPPHLGRRAGCRRTTPAPAGGEAPGAQMNGDVGGGVYCILCSGTGRDLVHMWPVVAVVGTECWVEEAHAVCELLWMRFWSARMKRSLIPVAVFEFLGS